MTPDEFEGTAERVKQGENGILLEALKRSSRAYLIKVRDICGFCSLTEPAVMERLVEDALHMAMARWAKPQCRFIMALRCEFLHCCRTEMRTRLIRSMVSLESQFPDGRDPIAEATDRRAAPPGKASETAELATLVLQALEREDERSHFVVRQWSKGEPYSQTAERLGITPLRARQICHENVDAMRLYLKEHCPTLFETWVATRSDKES